MTLALIPIEVLFTLGVTDLPPLGVPWLNAALVLTLVFLVGNQFGNEGLEDVLGTLVS